MKFQALPWSLSSFLALAAAAAPIPQTELSPATFKQTISHGVWLIEYFSPYCQHCREFAPTWDRLNSELSTHPGIHLAQVNCAIHGDFCSENGVNRFPQLTRYRDGEPVEQYQGRLDFDLLQAYIDKYAEPTAPHPVHEHIVDPVPVQNSNPNPSGTVLQLDTTTFVKAIERGPIFIKFFAPWCGHCKKLAPTWTELARHMQYQLDIAEVNCDENTALCTSQQVKGYPTLIFYSGGNKAEYTGRRKFDQLMSFVRDASAPPVKELADGELESQITSNDVMFLLLHTQFDNSVVDQVIQASRILLGSPPIYSSSSPDLFSQYSIPASYPWAILAFKDAEISRPAAKFYADTSSHSQESLTNWLLANRLPTSTELTQDTFQLVMKAPHQPLVVIAAVTTETKDKVAEKVRDIGKTWNSRGDRHENGNSREVIFTWMDAEKWASWLKSMYGIKAEPGSDPVIIVADHAQLSYYDVDQKGQSIKLTFTSISSAIDGISSGKIKRKSSENFVERMARYLNEKMISIQIYVSQHPWRALFCVGFALALAFFGLKRVASEGAAVESREHRHGHGKPRLD